MDRQEQMQGCLLGLAVGDALGYTVDSCTWQQIQADYGAKGLRGYDLVNGYAQVSSYTQLAAYAGNGLLLGLTQGQMKGRMGPLVSYIARAEREWAASQRRLGSNLQKICWVSQVKPLQGHCAMEPMMLDTLRRERLGSLEEPQNRYTGAASLTTAVPVGLFYHPQREKRAESDRLGAEAVALTHGSPLAFLPGALLANLIRVLQDGAQLRTAAADGLKVLHDGLGKEYPQAMNELTQAVSLALALSHSPRVLPVEAMEQLGCNNGVGVLAGALYACARDPADFDGAVIAAVNHSGRSAAVGAVTGALMGCMNGMSVITDFYLDGLEPVQALLDLAHDLYQGCPMGRDTALFDDLWSERYLHGRY